MKLTIGKQIGLGFGAAFVITGMLGWFATTRLATLETQSRVITSHSIPEVRNVAQIRFKSQELFGRALEHILKVQDKEQQAALEKEMNTDLAGAEELLAA